MKPSNRIDNSMNGWHEFYRDKFHYENGKLHRLDGPAIMKISGHQEWWIDHWYVDVKSQEEFEKSIQYRTWKLKSFK